MGRCHTRICRFRSDHKLVKAKPINIKWGHVWMFSALQGVFDDDLNRRSGASHVSGLYEAALMAAGPDEVRGSDPNQNIEHFAHNP